MLIQSARFGDLEIDESEIIHFPQGIPGFVDENRFIYLKDQADSPFIILQSVDNPNLAFLLADPFAFFNDYEFTIDDQIAKEMGLSADNLPQILNIITHKGEIKDMTVNLLAPIVINMRDKIGLQVILDKTEYPIRYKLFSNGLSGNIGKGGE